MANLKFLNSIVLLFISCVSLIGCAPSEPQLELKLGNQPVGQVFSLADYCEEKYDSILLLSPYVNTEREECVNLKMSEDLRILCESNTNFDTFSTLLFVINGKVEAYSEVILIDADFVLNGNTDYPQFFSFGQKLIMDKDRKVHLYNE